ncbi:MAG: hypothetical protein ACON5M_01620 [Chitinophagales bacterium]
MNSVISRILFVFSACIFMYGCKVDDGSLQQPSYPINPNVFIDGFSGGMDYYAFAGSDVYAFDLDYQTTYGNSEASMRFYVPDFDAAAGSYAGGVFVAPGGRDFSPFTALTFYMKASRSATIDVLGFGNDQGDFPTNVAFEGGVPVNTNWQKYYVPIPDPSKVTAETILLRFAEGPENGEGYTFWIDEAKFEDIGTFANPVASIMGGENIVQLAYDGIDVGIEDVSYSVNLPNGVDQSYTIASTYFDLQSSNEDVVRITPSNEIDIVGEGSALIRGYINGVEAEGTLTLNILGSLDPAPTPAYDPANVISIFSDVYDNVPVDFYNGYWEPFQTTTSEDFVINNDNVLNYVNFNFVGTQFSNPTIDASAMTHLHLDVFIPGAVQAGTSLTLILRDFGPDGQDGGGDDTDISASFNSSTLVQGAWNSLDIPIAGMANKSALGLLIYEGSSLPNFYADNIFFYN